jgi:hypothetical protein
METPILRLWEDILSAGTALPLPARPRMVFVVHGSLTIDLREFGDGEAWHGEGSHTLQAGKAGVCVWRWELSSGAEEQLNFLSGVRSREKLSALLETLPQGELLLRGDSVAFPAGGCAFPHRHQGPGIRCLIEGGIRIDTKGSSASYGPGAAWYESGPDAVFAQAAPDRPSRFIRVMILPLEFLGKSSFQYVNEEDEAKPRIQQYKILADAPIAWPRVRSLSV